MKKRNWELVKLFILHNHELKDFARNFYAAKLGHVPKSSAARGRKRAKRMAEKGGVRKGWKVGREWASSTVDLLKM